MTSTDDKYNCDQQYNCNQCKILMDTTPRYPNEDICAQIDRCDYSNVKTCNCGFICYACMTHCFHDKTADHHYDPGYSKYCGGQLIECIYGCIISIVISVFAIVPFILELFGRFGRYVCSGCYNCLVGCVKECSECLVIECGACCKELPACLSSIGKCITNACSYFKYLFCFPYFCKESIFTVKQQYNALNNV